MKKLFALLFCAVALGAVAQTPEQMIQQLPALPSVAEIMNYDKSVRQGEGLTFSLEKWADKVNAKMAQYEKQLKVKADQWAGDVEEAMMNQNVIGTNVSTRDFVQMSDAEKQAVAMQSVAGQLGKVGLNMSDLANLENMSEEEMNAMADKVLAAQTGGLTQKDIKAMEKMTDAQRAAYMKSKGLTSTPAQQNAKNKELEEKTQMGQQLIDAVARYQAAYQKYMAAEPIQEAIAQGEKIYRTKYAAKVQALNAQHQALVVAMEDDYANGAAIDAKVKQLTSQKAALESQFFAEYIPIYRAAVVKMCDIAKGEVVAACNEYKAAYDNAYKVTGRAEYMLATTFPYQSVNYYADALLSIAKYDNGFFEFNF